MPPAKKKKPAAKKPPAPELHGPRADFGKAIDGFFTKQPPATKPILVALRKLVEETVPDATAVLKWGMPNYSIDGKMMCALGGHKAHVNFIVAGPPDAFDDPDQQLEGEGKTGKHMKLTSVAQIPRARIKSWLRTAAEHARR